MIGILQNKELNAQRMTAIAQWHWERVQDSIKSTRAKTDSGQAVKDLLEAIKPYSLEDIVKADFKTLMEYKNSFPHEKIKQFEALKSTTINEAEKPKKGEHLLVIVYEKYRTKYGRELVEQLGLSVCPYCNRNYINNVEDYATAQFDHFLPKSQYPIFALSLYNLIPCCTTCNHIKGDKQIDVSPYDHSVTTDKLIHFNYVLKEMEKYEILIDTPTLAMDSNVRVLQLKSAYQYHAKMVKELQAKKDAMHNANLDSMKKIFDDYAPGMDMTFEEFFYGNYLSEDKYYMRSLAKFTHDIIDDIES